MSSDCFLVWAEIEDDEGYQEATWDGVHECMVIKMLVAVCDDRVIANAIAESITALKVWITETPMNTIRGRFAKSGSR